MPIQKVITTENVPIKIWTNDIDDNAVEQLKNSANLPFIFRHVAAMPDVHLGKGATIGSVIATKGAICPSAVGVDLSCGILAAKTTLKVENLTNLPALREEIEYSVPHGTVTYGKGIQGSWATVPGYVLTTWYENLNSEFQSLSFKGTKEPQNQLGTLGGGNHFIELCYDESNYIWILIHSGSRGIGNALGTYYINVAKQKMQDWFITLPDPDLAYLVDNTIELNDYIYASNWTSKYAEWNRSLILHAVLQVLNKPLLELSFDCHHNYVSLENHFNNNVYITRKGAIRARKNDYGVIPSSMGGTSYIVKGKGNRESFNSCAHGAGRLCGRKEATRRFTVEDLKRTTFGVECKKDLSVLDEIPLAYKDINTVMENQADLCEKIHILKAILTVKG